MELDINSRPAPPVSFSASPPHPSSSSVLAQRRRSSAAHIRPAAPPPNLPIPSVPVPPNPPLSQAPVDPLDDVTTTSHLNGRSNRFSSFARHAASPNLTAVSDFSHARVTASSPYSSGISTQSSIEDLSDPPPQSYLRPAVSQPDRSRDPNPNPDLTLLSPPEPRSEHRPSSRRALTRALELAREAVQLDSTNDNPEAAVHAYARSVALLSEVMDRVRRGEEADTGRRRRRRSVAAQEEEVRRLQNIHDTYADRMNILSIIYSIPAVPYANGSTYSSVASTDSTTSNSPTNSTSPSSDTSPQLLQHPHTRDESLDAHTERQQLTGLVNGLMDDRISEATPEISGLPPTSGHHPYAQAYDSGGHSAPSTGSTPPRRRSRAGSTIPPPNPPPMNALPPAPTSASVSAPVVVEPPFDSDTQTWQRGGSYSHRRTGSGLAALEEELEAVSLGQPDSADTRYGRSDAAAVVTTKRDSLPLPPIPSPSTDSAAGTPRTTIPPTARPPSSPRLVNVVASRPRASTAHSESNSQSQIINSTTTQGTIYQRRTKSSAPPSSRSSSPAGSTASVGSIPAKSIVPVASSSQITGRNRSSSQPGRRPSLIGGRISPLDHQPPPLPNGVPTGTRKSSLTANPGANPPVNSLFVNTDALSPTPLLNSPAIPGNLPTTPTSPLPPAPPNDPSLKPYHMMNLLRMTMTSTTGGYVTRRLHVPFEVWSQGGAKLNNVVEKVRVVGILCSALEDLQTSSAEQFGAGNVSSGMALGIGSIGRKEADAWLGKLEEFSNVCDSVVANFGKKLGVSEGFVLKKTTWGDKLTRRFDKFTNGKNLDSPAAYVHGLKKLFLHTQLLDEHTRAVISHPVAPAYAAFPPDSRTSAEQKLKRSSEFFATVVLTFVIRDLSLLLDKYVKKCEKWLAE